MADGVGRDYYEIMGLGRTAKQEDVKPMWRSRARQIHPDTSEYPDAEERFKNFSEAYSVLNNPGERELYDRFLASGFQGSFSEWKARAGPREMDPIDVIRDLSSGDRVGWERATTYLNERLDAERNPPEARMSVISNIINTGFDINFVQGARRWSEQKNFFHAASIVLTYLVGDPEHAVSSTAKNSFTAFITQHARDEVPDLPEDAWNNLGVGLTSPHEHARNNSIILVSELTERNYRNLPGKLVELLQEIASSQQSDPVMRQQAQASLQNIGRRPQRLPVEDLESRWGGPDIPDFMRRRERN